MTATSRRDQLKVCAMIRRTGSSSRQSHTTEGRVITLKRDLFNALCGLREGLTSLERGGLSGIVERPYLSCTRATLHDLQGHLDRPVWNWIPAFGESNELPQSFLSMYSFSENASMHGTISLVRGWCYDPGPVACILDGLRRIFGYHFPHAYVLTHYDYDQIRDSIHISHYAPTDVDLIPALS